MECVQPEASSALLQQRTHAQEVISASNNSHIQKLLMTNNSELITMNLKKLNIAIF